MANTIISFKDVSKQYDDDDPVLKKINFDIEEGRFYTLLGPSGCGKTTILKLSPVSQTLVKAIIFLRKTNE